MGRVTWFRPGFFSIKKKKRKRVFPGPARRGVGGTGGDFFILRISGLDCMHRG